MMMIRCLLIFFLFPVYTSGNALHENNFHEYAFRFDFLIGGNANEINVYPRQMKLEPLWGGPMSKFIDPFNYGTYQFKIINSESKEVIFSRGFSTLFQEWQTTAEAKVINRMFYQCLLFPYPKQKFKLKIEARQWSGEFKEVYNVEIDPDDYFILKEPVQEFNIFDVFVHGDPVSKVDIVLLAEGYKETEMDKFECDAQRLTGFLFEEEPFKSAKTDFNVRAVFTPSIDSGTDIPGEGIYKNTAFGSSFYTFNIDRYLTATDVKAIYDAAANVPYDYIYVLVNNDRYGGGGIYNSLNVCTSGHPSSREVFIHEFGHGFAGLGDEYYSSSVAYENFYNTDIEPWEPNLTTLVNFNSKWVSMVPDTVPVPTPRKIEYSETVGAFEGGGYQLKGIFSPYIECRMKSNDAKGFCPVCINAIQRVIDFHCK